jgi:hypothetical protein
MRTTRRRLSRLVESFLDLNCKTQNNAERNILDFAFDKSSEDQIPALNNTWRQSDMALLK